MKRFHQSFATLFVVGFAQLASASSQTERFLDDTRLLYECKAPNRDFLDFVDIYGDARDSQNALGAEAITRVGVRVGGESEEKVNSAVINRRNAAGQVYHLYSSRDGVTPSGDLLEVILYNTKDRNGLVYGLFVLYPTTKRIEVPIVCVNMR